MDLLCWVFSTAFADSLTAGKCCWYLDPFALCPAFPDSLGGRDSTDYYGSAAPDSPLAICPPIPYGRMFQVPALLTQHVLC